MAAGGSIVSFAIRLALLFWFLSYCYILRISSNIKVSGSRWIENLNRNRSARVEMGILNGHIYVRSTITLAKNIYIRFRNVSKTKNWLYYAVIFLI